MKTIPLSQRRQIDHRDKNGLNNQIGNLREATISQQRINRRKAEGCSSRFKGVCWCTQKQKWRAYIGTSGKDHEHLGFHKNEEAAASAYDAVPTTQCL